MQKNKRNPKVYNDMLLLWSAAGAPLKTKENNQRKETFPFLWLSSFVFKGAPAERKSKRKKKKQKKDEERKAIERKEKKVNKREATTQKKENEKKKLW